MGGVKLDAGDAARLDFPLASYPTMHRPRPSSLTESAAPGDQVADWLLIHCPFSTLALLTLVLVGSALPFSRPFVILLLAMIADVLLSFVRRGRRARRAAEPQSISRHAPV